MLLPEFTGLFFGVPSLLGWAGPRIPGVRGAIGPKHSAFFLPNGVSDFDRHALWGVFTIGLGTFFYQGPIPKL